MNLFTCDRHAGHLRLTEESCADQWRRAQRVQRDHPLYPCRGCPIGARHAGCEPPVLDGRLPAEAMCARCHRQSTRFIHGRLCVSCYNRGLEWSKGRNGKGTKPIFLPPLFTARIAYIKHAECHEVSIEHVASHLEAVLSVARREAARVVFVRARRQALVERAA